MKVVSKQTNSKMCMICGLENKFGLKANFYNMENGTVASIFTFKKEHQSYPERVHGGMLSALLDELAGRALWVTNPELLGVTATLTMKYRKPVPYDEELIGIGEITNRNGRIFTAKGKIMTKDKKVLVESDGSYVILPNKQIASEDSLKPEDLMFVVEDDVTEIDL